MLSSLDLKSVCKIGQKLLAVSTRLNNQNVYQNGHMVLTTPPDGLHDKPEDRGHNLPVGRRAELCVGGALRYRYEVLMHGCTKWSVASSHW